MLVKLVADTGPKLQIFTTIPKYIRKSIWYVLYRRNTEETCPNYKNVQASCCKIGLQVLHLKASLLKKNKVGNSKIRRDETYPIRSAARTAFKSSDRSGKVRYISDEGNGVCRNQPTFILESNSFKYFGRHMRW